MKTWRRIVDTHIQPPATVQAGVPRRLNVDASRRTVDELGPGVNAPGSAGRDGVALARILRVRLIRLHGKGTASQQGQQRKTD